MSVTMTIGGVPVHVEQVSWSPVDPLPPRETIGEMAAEGSFTLISADRSFLVRWARRWFKKQRRRERMARKRRRGWA